VLGAVLHLMTTTLPSSVQRSQDPAAGL